jgi:Trypsin-like peptidase domain
MIPRRAMLGVGAAMLAGCGAGSRTVTITATPTRTTPISTTAKTTPTTRARSSQVPVSASVIARTENAVVDAGCSTTGQTGVARTELGTAFAIVPGNTSLFITASHVAAMCVGGSMGANDATVAVTEDDVTHDVAVLQETDGGPPVVLGALRLSTGAVHVGELVALIGYSGQTGALRKKVDRPLSAVPGIVTATNRPQTLTSPQGLRETLADTIEVAAPGVMPGESGGPAIDAAGKVVGVIEGTGEGFVALTPSADVIALAGAPGASSLPVLIAGTWTGIKPSEIDFSGDAGNIVTRISWSSWTATGAVGEGTSGIQSCVPNCAQGTTTYVPTTIALSKPRGGHFTKLSETRSGASSTWAYPQAWPLSAS